MRLITLRLEPYPRLSLPNHLMSVIRIFFLFLFCLHIEASFNRIAYSFALGYVVRVLIKRLFVDVIQEIYLYSIAKKKSSDKLKFKLSVFVKMMVETIIGEDDPFYEKLRQTTTTATATTKNLEATELQVGFVLIENLIKHFHE